MDEADLRAAMDYQSRGFGILCSMVYHPNARTKKQLEAVLENFESSTEILRVMRGE